MKKIIYILILSGCLSEPSLQRAYPVIDTSAVDFIKISGATFSASIIYSSLNPIVEHGFIWGTSTELTLDSQDSFYSKLGKLDLNSFKQQITSTLRIGQIYNVRAYVQTAGTIVYGPIVSFVSLGSEGPRLLKIDPPIADIGQRIKLLGTGFSLNLTANEVLIDKRAATVLAATESSLEVEVPFVTKRNPDIFIRINNGDSPSKNDLLQVRVPTLNLNPSLPGQCDEITISGENWPDLTGLTPSVFFNQSKATVIIANNNTLITSSPKAINGPVQINLVWFEDYTTSSSPFQFSIPAIGLITPFAVNLGEYLTINGTNFSLPISMTIDNISVTPQLVDSNTIRVQINQKSSINPDIILTICEEIFTLPDAFQIN